MPEPTILFQPPNTVGLGHINRLAAIALSVRSRLPNAKLPFVVDGSSHGHLKSLGLAELDVPPEADICVASEWDHWPVTQRADLALALCETILEHLRPDLVVFDCLPAPHFALATIRRNIPIALCIRQVKDMTSYLEMVGHVIAASRLFLIPHSREEFHVPQEIFSRSLFVGDIVRPLHLATALPLHSKSSKLIIITGGGGGHDGTLDFYNQCLEAFRLLRKTLADVTGILVTGPLFNRWLELKLADCMKIVPYYPHTEQLFRTADLVICQAGYNTIQEISCLGTPSICIPGTRIHDDQHKRAMEVASKTHNVSVYTKGDVAELSGLMAALLNSDQHPIRRPPPPGADLAAEALCNLIR